MIPLQGRLAGDPGRGGDVRVEPARLGEPASQRP